MTLENTNLHLQTDMAIEPQVSHAGDQETYYSCLIVDEGFDETMTRLQVNTCTLTCACTTHLGSFIFFYFRPSKKGQMFLVQISIKRELAGAFFFLFLTFLFFPIDCFLYILLSSLSCG